MHSDNTVYTQCVYDTLCTQYTVTTTIVLPPILPTLSQLVTLLLFPPSFFPILSSFLPSLPFSFSFSLQALCKCQSCGIFFIVVTLSHPEDSEWLIIPPPSLSQALTPCSQCSLGFGEGDRDVLIGVGCSLSLSLIALPTSESSFWLLSTAEALL